MNEPGLGDVMVTATNSRVGALIRWVEGKPRFTSPWLFWLFWDRAPAQVNHVGVYVGHGQIVEGRPGLFPKKGEPRGAGIALLEDYPEAIWLNLPIPDGQRPYVQRAALGMVGTRYGWLNCFCIGLVRVFGWKAPKWALKVLASRDWEECAQLADAAMTIAADEYEPREGLRLFTDGRPEGLVSPQDIYDEWGHHAVPGAHLGTR